MAGIVVKSGRQKVCYLKAKEAVTTWRVALNEIICAGTLLRWMVDGFNRTLVRVRPSLKSDHISLIVVGN